MKNIEKKLLLKKLKEIDNSIRLNYYNEELTGVLAGTAGISMFQFHYSKYLDNDKHATLATEILESCIQNIKVPNISMSFCSGISGLGWTLCQLAAEEFIENDLDEFFIKIDEAVFDTMVSNLRRGNFDFLHGGIGNALYFLNRYRITNSDKLKITYKERLLDFIIELELLSEKDGCYVKWPSKMDFSNKGKSYDLGLSHGIAGIISFLAKLYNYDDFRQQTEDLFRGAIRYLLSYQNSKLDTVSLFPSSISEKGGSYSCRLSWCYGDLGIGIALYNASKVLNDKTLEIDSLKILEYCTDRTHPENTGVCDASICHGSFGICLVFNRIYRETGNQQFKNAAKFWLEDGLKKATHKNGHAGFKQWDTQEQNWYSTLSVLEGISGIGLTLINYLADYNTKWDECLMIS